ncbi:DUF6809 family protein [Cohnella mopanensis]|uniref:DUF6809 family protein n=1 Tax=Cohnella mopanensis TaxID=2911966 RepID=UPI001EF7B062|nr:DUF6809 family protein [Cohnella mopanensis]
MKEWIKEVITKRYEALSEEAESKGELMTLREQANTYENLLIRALSDETREVLNKWMEIHDQMVSFQKQWLYIKGVQDGSQLVITLERDS